MKCMSAESQAIKELKQKTEELENQTEELENRIEKMEKMLTSVLYRQNGWNPPPPEKARTTAQIIHMPKNGKVKISNKSRK